MIYDSEIAHLVENSLANKEQLVEINVNISRYSKLKGFIGEIIFVNVNGITENNERKSFDLAVKYLRNDRKHMESAIYSTVIEFNMYNKVLPSLQIFLSENRLPNELYFIPKQYECTVTNIENVIIMENLKYTGYKLHDKKQHMNVNHIKTVIREYAILHAISFAVRKHKPELYQELTKVLIEKDPMKYAVIHCIELRESTLNNLNSALTLFKENGDESLHHLLRTAIPKHPCDVIWDIIKTEELKTAICHGDSWNNNYLFKYEKDDCIKPIGVKIIDWQLSGIRSPVCDISYFLYSCASQEELEIFDEILEFYYETFSTFLLKMGNNPQELFTFADLKSHWKSYGLYGVISSLNSLKVELSDEEPIATDCEDENIASFDLPIFVGLSLIFLYVVLTYLRKIRRQG